MNRRRPDSEIPGHRQRENPPVPAEDPKAIADKRS